METVDDNVVEEHKSLNGMVKDFLVQHCPVFEQLSILKKKGWENTAGDIYFDIQRKNADQADEKTKRAFFYMMRDLGNQLNTATGVFTVLETAEDAECKFLDLCMAPGGFSQYLLQLYPRAKAFGISLPLADGGHQMLLNLRDPRVTVKFLDITMLYSEMMSTPTIDAIQIPLCHPDRGSFLRWRPYLHERFDLVLCDGQVLRTHERHQYRETAEPTRLLMSQLILGLKRIRPGGNMVVLLHKLEHWNPLVLLDTFRKFSEVQLFKSEKQHAKRSSFYMIAKNVQPTSQEARDATVRWTKSWLSTTFEGEVREEIGATRTDVNMLLSQFGLQYIDLGVPVWKTQKEALERWGYCQETGNEDAHQHLEGKSPSDVRPDHQNSLSIIHWEKDVLRDGKTQLQDTPCK